MQRIRSACMWVGAAALFVVLAHVALAQERARVADPSQVELHGELDRVTAAAREEAEREMARRLAPFDLWWAVR